MEGKEVKRARAVIYYGITVLIGLFLFFYVRMASVEIVYSDYIRLIHQYLPDTLASEKFFVPDILTRIPITYLFRFINIKYFHYLLAFDRTVGVIGFLLFAFVITLLSPGADVLHLLSSRVDGPRKSRQMGDAFKWLRLSASSFVCAVCMGLLSFRKGVHRYRRAAG